MRIKLPTVLEKARYMSLILLFTPVCMSSMIGEKIPMLYRKRVYIASNTHTLVSNPNKGLLAIH